MSNQSWKQLEADVGARALRGADAGRRRRTLAVAQGRTRAIAYGRTLAIALAVCLGAVEAMAAEIVEVRVGRHPEFTRVVFELDRSAGYRIERSTPSPGVSELVVSLDATSIPRRLQTPKSMIEQVEVEPRGGRSVARIRLAKSGLRLKEMILASPPRIVLDVLSDEPVAKATPKSAPAPKPAPEPAVAEKKPEPAPQRAAGSSAEKAGKTSPQAGTRPVARAEAPAPKPAPRPTARPAPAPERTTEAPKTAAETAAAARAAAAGTAKTAATAGAEATTAAEKSASGASAAASKGLARAGASDAAGSASESAKARAEQETAEAEAAGSDAGTGAMDLLRARERQLAARGEPSTSTPVEGEAAPARKSPKQEKAAAKPAQARPAPRPMVARTPEPEGSGWLTWALAAVGAVVLAVGGFLFLRSRRGGEEVDFEEEVDASDDAPVEFSGRKESGGEDAENPFAGLAGDDGQMSLGGPDEATVPPGMDEEGDTTVMSTPGDRGRPSESLAFGDSEEKDMDSMEVISRDAVNESLGGMPSMGSLPEEFQQMMREMNRRVEALESRIDELVDARDRLERQVAAQTEELRVQRAAIARTQRAVRNLARPEDENEPTEPALRDPNKPGVDG